MKTTTTELKRRRADVLKQLHQVRAEAKQYSRDLSADEQARWDGLMSQIRDLDVDLAEAEDVDRRRSGPFTPIGAQGGSGNANGSAPYPVSDGVLLGPRQSVRDWATDKGLISPDAASSFGAWAIGAMNGSFALSGDVGPQGGYALPMAIVADVLDLARSKAVCVAAGAQTLPIAAREYTWPRLTSDPTANWVAEGDTIPQDSAMAFGAISSPVHSLKALVLATKELVQDVEAFSNVMSNALGEALALKLDLAALRGDGINQPLGIKNTSGVNGVTVNAAPANFDKLVDGVVAVRTSNFEPNAVIAHPRDWGTLSRLKDTTNQPLNPPADVEGLTHLSTTSIPINEGAGTNESAIFIGDFSQLVFVVRAGFEVQPLVERYADEGKVGFLATLRADATVIREGAFAVLTGVQP